MRVHHLFTKCSKCFFGETSVNYLDHIVTTVGVTMNPAKVEVLEAWPCPHSPHALHGFLGLIGYYWKFFAGYGGMAEPLMALVKREAFAWTVEVDAAFLALKKAFTSAPIIQLPNFTKHLVIDYDASGARFGVVLHQGDSVVAFFIQVVAPHHAKLPVYERELIGLVKAVRHWRPYL